MEYWWNSESGKVTGPWGQKVIWVGEDKEDFLKDTVVQCTELLSPLQTIPHVEFSSEWSIKADITSLMKEAQDFPKQKWNPVLKHN